MRINDQNLTGISSSQLGRTQETESGNRHGRGAGPGAAGNDQVQLSSLAGSLQALTGETPERAAHLERLSAEVAAGRYTVDAQALSQKIVDEAIQNRT